MTATRLAAQIEQILSNVSGTVGVAAVNLATGETVNRNADEPFPSASVIKLAILVELFAQAHEGTVDLAETRTLREEEKVDGSGVLKEMRAPLDLTLEELARLMIVISDNTASNMLIDRLTTEAINDRLQTLGLTGTVLGRRFYDFEARARGLENLATPGDVTALLARIERRELVSATASEAMLAVLLRQQISDKIPALLPEGTKVANKTGTITGASHDAGIIYSPAGPLALSVFTMGLAEPDGEAVIRRIALAVWDAWAPKNETADERR